MRLIIDDSLDAATNMAKDMALFQSYLSGNSLSTLRFYSWQNPTLSLGKFQKITNIDVDSCRTKGIDIVRRPTGGKAVIHLPSELTYSLVGGLKSGLPDTLAKSYWYVCRAVIEGLSMLGVDASMCEQRIGTNKEICYMAASMSDIKVKGKKLVGSAQLREGTEFLQHGSIPVSSCIDYLGWAFKFSSRDSLEKQSKAFEMSTTCLDEQLSAIIEKEDVVGYIIKGFERAWSCKLEPTELNDYELSLIELYKNKYSRYF